MDLLFFEMLPLTNEYSLVDSFYFACIRLRACNGSVLYKNTLWNVIFPHFCLRTSYHPRINKFGHVRSQ